MGKFNEVVEQLHENGKENLAEFIREGENPNEVTITLSDEEDANDGAISGGNGLTRKGFALFAVAYLQATAKEDGSDEGLLSGMNDLAQSMQ